MQRLHSPGNWENTSPHLRYIIHVVRQIEVDISYNYYVLYQQFITNIATMNII